MIKAVIFLILLEFSQIATPNSQRNYYKNNYLYVEDEGFSWICLVVGFCMSTYHPIMGDRPNLLIVSKWKQLEFDYNSLQDRQQDIINGVFIPGIPAPIDVDVYYPKNNLNKIFVTIPRFQNGSPATLGTVLDDKSGNNPKIRPYPSWSWHRNPTQCSSNRIVSVYRVQIDECGRLWVLDTGRLESGQVCPPQILAFDLETDNMIHKFEIPANLLESRSILVTPTVDVRGCQNTFVYVADCQTYSVIVYDVQRRTAWKATDKSFYPYPNYGTFSIQGDSFDLMDGVLGMTLSPYKPGTNRILYYHAMSSPTENWVYTSDLRNQSRFMHNPESSPEVFHTYRGRRSSQSAAEATDKNGIIYYGTMTDTSINCWNTAFDYGTKATEVLAQNPEILQFASGLKVITNKKGEEEIWILTSRFQKVATGTLNMSEFNFRILAGRIDDMVFGTKCKNEPKISGLGGYGLVKPKY